jgi:hypothetical protein
MDGCASYSNSRQRQQQLRQDVIPCHQEITVLQAFNVAVTVSSKAEARSWLKAVCCRGGKGAAATTKQQRQQ